MTFHIPSIEAAEAVARREVRAAAELGLYSRTWRKSSPDGGKDKKSGHVPASMVIRIRAARIETLRLIVNGIDTSTGVAQATGKTMSPIRQRFKAMAEEGLVELHKGRINSPIRATITPAGRAWLAEHDSAGGEA